VSDLRTAAQESGSGSAATLEVAADLEPHRRELTAFAYRMLGSAFEAEDAVQETMVRAWRGIGNFEGRSALRSWLYRIATNVCLDMLKGRERRALPMDLGPSQHTPDVVLGDRLPEATWIQPIPDDRVGRSADPAETAILRETIQLAFVTVLQLLPPRQRAVLILREVLQWRAAEVADLLETSVASVNSALQRARATLAASSSPLTPQSSRGQAPQPVDQELLTRYLSAFEAYDVTALVQLLHEDVVMSMPPYDLWLQGRSEFSSWLLGPGIGCIGSRLIPTTANGSPAFGQYRLSSSGEGYEPWAIHVLEVDDGGITAITYFLDTQLLFPLFGLPARL
jgi:RNA polymerase sigma-70 factor (ECF subfamily)